MVIAEEEEEKKKKNWTSRTLTLVESVFNIFKTEGKDSNDS